MKPIVIFLYTFSFLFTCSPAFALGGNGATCNPSTPNWGSCALAEVPFAASVTNTVNVTGGAWSTPYEARTANTRYVLQGDVTADGIGFVVYASYVIIDLNGHTLTYNKTTPGEGVTIGESNIHHVSVRNGSIIQSTANLGKVFSAGVNSGGTGYTMGDVLTLDGPTDATVTVTGTSGGEITSIALTSGGLGFDATYRSENTGAYVSGFNGVVSGGTGTGAIIDVIKTVSEGDLYGRGCNPVGSYNSAAAWTRTVDSGVHIANLYLKYSGRDVSGITFSASDSLYEQNTLEDTYQYGTLKDRHQGIDALASSKATNATGNIIRYNTLVNARHRGIQTGSSAEAYGNHISTRSIATNAVGITSYGGSNISIHDNTIIGRGEHPTGIGATGGSNWDVYNNLIDLQTTALGIEYGSAYLADPSKTYLGNESSGFRTTWGLDNSRIYNNTITIATSARYIGTYSPTGETAYIDGGGKGIMAGINQGQTVYFHNNNITVTGDGSYTTGIACSANASDGLFFTNNIVTSNKINITIGDDYGECSGYPLFLKNTLVKSGSSIGYATIANTYNSSAHEDTGRFSENVYQNGASESSISLKPADAGTTDVYFDSVTDGIVSYEYRLHDNNGASSALLKENFIEPLVLKHKNPIFSYIKNIKTNESE